MLGFIMMGGSASLETQIHRSLPANIEMATTRVPFHNVSYRGLLDMADKIPEAARILAEARPSVIAVTSFTGSCIRGNEMVNMIHQATGIPAIVPSLELVRILRLLGAKRLALVTCFTSELVMLEQVFFRNNHFEIVRVVETPTMHGDEPFQVSLVDHALIMARLRQADFTDVDAVVIDLPTFIFSEEFQREIDGFLHIPVLNMVRVLLWSALEMVDAPMEGLYLNRFLPT